jgi:hypothetical protein
MPALAPANLLEQGLAPTENPKLYPLWEAAPAAEWLQ